MLALRVQKEAFWFHPSLPCPSERGKESSITNPYLCHAQLPKESTRQRGGRSWRSLCTSTSPPRSLGKGQEPLPKAALSGRCAYLCTQRQTPPGRFARAAPGEALSLGAHSSTESGDALLCRQDSTRQCPRTGFTFVSHQASAHAGTAFQQSPSFPGHEQQLTDTPEGSLQPCADFPAPFLATGLCVLSAQGNLAHKPQSI